MASISARTWVHVSGYADDHRLPVVTTDEESWLDLGPVDAVFYVDVRMPEPAARKHARRRGHGRKRT
jgi:hypothetical protein